MAIQFLKEYNIFQLDTANTSYLIGIADEEKFLGHIYYGSKIRPGDASYLLRTGEPPYVPSRNGRDRTSFYDQFPFEYPGNGLGDYRESAIAVETLQGNTGVMATLEDYEILDKKPVLEGLPSSFGNDGKSLVLHCRDKVLGLEVDLLYSVFEAEDVITRSVTVRNGGEAPLWLTKVYSACVDMDNRDYEMVTLHGSWARERQIDVRSLGYGKQSVGSVRGETSHQEHPFLALRTSGTTQERGEVYGFQFAYSGNFLAQVEKTQMDMLRVVMGIHPEGFKWKLEPGEKFTAPEAILTFSEQGMGRMSRNFHDFLRGHMIRSPYRDRKRPILINNWEATYFDFDTEKLLKIAEKAAQLGIEMLVMDDGWFGHRNDDNSSLGDWFVNEEKLPGGLKYLVDRVNALGMKFGIWFEPEMISPDSELYREHPDWAIRIPGRDAALCRNQYVLDISRKDVRNYVYNRVKAVLDSANIEYVKWDMNRQLCDIGSACLGRESQGELMHRYVLGVYEMQERLVTEFPGLLLENCSGGGARFDPGMLYYSPQIWCSDDVDAMERLRIQEGTALIYPLSTMGAHVGDCPNHIVGRNTPFDTRAHVAMAGTFGYELDITKIAEEERAKIPAQVEEYHRYQPLMQRGDYYRLASWSDRKPYDCWEVAAKDGSEALVTFVQVLAEPNMHSRAIFLRGLKEDAEYALEGTEEVYGGDELMYCGYLVPSEQGDFVSRLYHFVRVG